MGRQHRIYVPVTTLTWATPWLSRRTTPIWDGVAPFLASLQIWSTTYWQVRDRRDVQFVDQIIPPALEWSSTMLEECASMGWQRRICPFRYCEGVPWRRFKFICRGVLVDWEGKGSRGRGRRRRRKKKHSKCKDFAKLRKVRSLRVS